MRSQPIDSRRSRHSAGRMSALVQLVGAAALSSLLHLPAMAQSTQPSAPPAAPSPPVSQVQSTPLGTPAPAQAVPNDQAAPVVPPDIIEGLQKASDALARTEAGLEKIADSDDQLVTQRTQAEEVQAEAQRLAEALAPRRTTIKDQIDKLGPLPAKDQPPEGPVLAQDRARLQAQLAEIDAQIKKTELLQLRVRQVTRRIQDLRHTIFTRDLLRRTQSPLHPSVWMAVAHEWPVAGQELLSVGQSWWARIVERWPVAIAVLIGALLSNVALRWLFRRLVLRWQRIHSGADPTFFQRASVSAILALAAAIPNLTAAGALYGGFAAFDLFGSLTGQIAESAIAAYAAYTIIAALASALLEPRLARWHLFELDDAVARRLAFLIKGTAAVYALDRVVHDLIRQFYLTLPVSIVATFIASLAFAALLIGIVRTAGATSTPVAVAETSDGTRDSAEPGATGSRLDIRWLRAPLLTLALVVIGASLLGYVALGRFIAGHVLLTGSGLTLMFLLHLAIRAIAERAAEADTRIGRFLTKRFGLDADRRAQFGHVLGFCLNAALVAIGVPLMLMAWGFSGLDVSRTAKAAVFGFEIGHFRISLARLLIAAGLFLGLIFLTRVLRAWMQKRVFPAAKFDAGVSHSIDTGIGYAGFAVAGVAAISYAGFDVSNFAIVAGALSVGIGFGLQSIVNNFVSGLILLVERPVKVGDWIVVKDREGVVRNISVRSTEIETFDRSSLIVPNSELIAGSVVNWTHRNSIGRLRIKVGVSYDADPARVRDLLYAIAERNAQVLSHPKPQVVFDDLGASTMDFSLRVYLADIYDVLDVQTDLRIAIVTTFRREGIEIPVPQYDVRIRSALPAPTRSITEAADDDRADAQSSQPVSIKLAR